MGRKFKKIENEKPKYIVFLCHISKFARALLRINFYFNMSLSHILIFTTILIDPHNPIIDYPSRILTLRRPRFIGNSIEAANLSLFYY
jgi:hypothetical protein